MVKKAGFWGWFWKICLILTLPCMLSSTTKFGVGFFGLLTVGGLVMAVCQNGRNRLARLIYRVGQVVFGIWLVSFVAVEGWILVGSISQEIPQDADYLLVLGAGLRGENPSATLQGRIDLAEEILRTHPQTKAVLCGGQGTDEVMPESHVMRRVMIEDGIAPERILVEDASRTTRQNVKYAVALMTKDHGSADYQTAFVSSNFHLPRARKIMENNGLTPIGAGSHTRYILVDGLCFVREYFAWGKFVLTSGLG
jgi:uncharacterized SAM-binding protein YcdF (DUF218 family)